MAQPSVPGHAKIRGVVTMMTSPSEDRDADEDEEESSHTLPSTVPRCRRPERSWSRRPWWLACVHKAVGADELRNTNPSTQKPRDRSESARPGHTKVARAAAESSRPRQAMRERPGARRSATAPPSGFCWPDTKPTTSVYGAEQR